jgi:type III secretion protein O
MNVVGDLLRIKEFRENRAEMEVSRTRHALQEATKALERARHELQEFRTSCERRERELYADMCSRLVRLTDLNDLMLTVQDMQEDIRSHEGHVTTADDARKSAAENLDQARQGHKLAIRAREKFSELALVDDADRVAEQQRAEDLEIEDIRLKSTAGRAPETGDSSPEEQDDEPMDSDPPRRRALAHIASRGARPSRMEMST